MDEEDIAAVVEVLRSDRLTTGPEVSAFEEAVRRFTGAKHAVVVSSGTAALHAAMHAAGIRSGDEVIVPAMTFAASANAVVYQGGIPVFADVDPETLLIDPKSVRSRTTDRTRAVLGVDFAGQPADYEALRHPDQVLIADACHSFGIERIGTGADLNVLSFHPVKAITSGEGGMVLTDDESFSTSMQRFRNHGIDLDDRARIQKGTWFYEMTDLGFNYRLSDIQCALGRTQLKKLPRWVKRRQSIAAMYDEAFSNHDLLSPLGRRPDTSHAYHLYVVRLNLDRLSIDRAGIFAELRREGIGVNVHYIPVHLHPYYRKNFGLQKGECPVAEAEYERIISIPMYPAMSDADVQTVILKMKEVLGRHAL